MNSYKNDLNEMLIALDSKKDCYYMNIFITLMYTYILIFYIKLYLKIS